MNQAESARQMGMKTIVFVDEIHPFQQGRSRMRFSLLWKKGSTILIGATTENPSSFEINAALVSRCKVLCCRPLHHR